MRKNDIETILPEFAKAVNEEKSDTILFHHVAFSNEEYELLGAAIKYATSKGKNVQVISDNYPDEKLREKLEKSTFDFFKNSIVLSLENGLQSENTELFCSSKHIICDNLAKTPP